MDTSKPSESMEHTRSGSSVLGSALDVVRQFQEYLDVRLSHTFSYHVSLIAIVSLPTMLTLTASPSLLLTMVHGQMQE